MSASKSWFVGTTYNIKSQKTDLGTKIDDSKDFFLKIRMNSHVPTHEFKKINVKIFWKFQNKIQILFKKF